ncbi:hypothetical protein J6590_024692 [Homalodisca vitripennis]|nr:hypothetical protein J6590_024692 [Homalodisca vitripennis]
MEDANTYCGQTYRTVTTIASGAGKYYVLCNTMLILTVVKPPGVDDDCQNRHYQSQTSRQLHDSEVTPNDTAAPRHCTAAALITRLLNEVWLSSYLQYAKVQRKLGGLVICKYSGPAADESASTLSADRESLGAYSDRAKWATPPY